MLIDYQEEKFFDPDEVTLDDNVKILWDTVISLAMRITEIEAEIEKLKNK